MDIDQGIININVIKIGLTYGGDLDTIKMNTYIDYWNNYLTVERFSEDHNIDQNIMEEIVNQGREIYKQRTKSIQRKQYE